MGHVPVGIYPIFTSFFAISFVLCRLSKFYPNIILGVPGADSGGEGKSKRVGKYGTKKSKERRKEPLGTMSYQTSSKRSPPFWLLIGQKNTKVFWHQSEARTAATVWNWSGKTLSPFFTFLRAIFFRPFRLSLAPTICPWVSEDAPTWPEKVICNSEMAIIRNVAKYNCLFTLQLAMLL